MKKLLVLVLVMGLMAGFTSPVLAGEAANDGTGEDSENYAIEVGADLKLVLNLNYDADIHNFTFASANTGFNHVDGDDDNLITTLSAGALANTSNFQNTNLTVIDGEEESGTSASNTETGKNSENWAVAADLKLVGVVNVNDADICNFTVASANTGFNYIGFGNNLVACVDQCGGVGDNNSITSGPALATANTTNVQNTNLTAISGVGNDGVTAANSGTGEDSFNVAGGLDLDAVVVVNLNDAYLKNSTVAMANSGFNGITGDDENSITTGTADATANTTNVQNTNLTEISGSGETGATGNSATNSDTGEGECSENWAVAADIDATAVVNVNDADLSNKTVATSNSGFNGVSGDDANSVTTGGATATANTTNVQNTNLTEVGDASCLPPICDVGGCQPSVCED